MKKIRLILILLTITFSIACVSLLVFNFLLPKAGGLLIETSPASTIYIDGEEVGRSPYTALRKSGEISLRLIPDSFGQPLAPFEDKITLVSGVETVVRRFFGNSDKYSEGEILTFEKLTERGASGITIISDPENIQIEIDGVKIRRILDEKIFQEHKYNGHVPVSAIYAFLGILNAVLYKYSYCIMANEYSSNFGNTKYKGEIIAASYEIFWSNIGFYHHAALLPKYKKIPVSYLLQWEAIREAKKRGCGVYDFWGYADPKKNPNHPYAGPTLFKMGFGGQKYEYVKTQDYVISPKYWLNYIIESARKIKRGL